jgi:CheY-like chemotaxis protein
VDDDPDTRLILQRYLREAGLETSAAHDGLSALKILARSHVDLVLLDLLMPGMDGFAVLERIRKTDHGRDVPVVVLTAAELTEEQEEGLADASEVILKADDLETRLRAVLDRHFGVSRGEEERS